MSFLKIPKSTNTSRKILHVDMDAFYASVEEQIHPEYREKALVVSKDPKRNGYHGVITTANYIARQYGVHSAMPAAKALDLIPKDKLVFVEPHFDRYREVSAQIHDIFHQVTDHCESVALDEVYLDVTENKLNENNVFKIVNYLQQRIYRATNLRCSIGISYNKFLAKMASNYAKPFGRTIINPDFAQDFLKRIPIGKFHGVGKKFAEKLNDIGIYTGKDVQNIDSDVLITSFKKAGYNLYLKSFGIDESEVVENRIRKSISKENTYNQSIRTEEKVAAELKKLTHQVFATSKEKKLQAKTISIKIRNEEFKTISKQNTVDHYISNEEECWQLVLELLQSTDIVDQNIRLLGVGLSNFDDLTYEEIPLFD